MKKNSFMNYAFMLLISAFLASCSKDGSSLLNQSAQKSQAVQNDQSLVKRGTVHATVTNFGPGLAFPRGLKFGPDGNLYVALAGLGGTLTTTCTQVIPPVGPYRGGYTGQIVKLNSTGALTVVADKMPSGINQFGDIIGPQDVAFIGNDLYALQVAGCSKGIPDPTSVVKINSDGSWSVVADLSAYMASHPVAAPEVDDFEPDGTPYSMINVRGDFYLVEANHGELIKATTSGQVSRVLDFSAHYGHIVPTAVGYHGNFYVGNLNTFPLVEGSSSIYKVTPDGSVEVWTTGFTGITGVAFDAQNRLYVMETSAASGFPTPGKGRVVRVNNDKTKDVIVDNLTFPTAMTFGPDGALYISNTGYGPPTGQIVKVVF